MVAIIAILASLLLSGLSKAKNAADFAKCKSNLRQLSIAMSLYLGDFSAYPGDYSPLRPNRFYVLGWQDQLIPYAGTRRPGPSNDGLPFSSPQSSVFSCPSYIKVKGTFYEQGSCYGYNKGGVSREFGNNYSSGRHGQLGLGGDLLISAGTSDFLRNPTAFIKPIGEQAVLQPSEMVIMSDSLILQPPFGSTFPGKNSETLWGMADNSVGIAQSEVWLNKTFPLISMTKRRHTGKLNVVFCDSHIQALKPEKIFDGVNREVRRLWNNDNLPHMEFR